MEEWSNWSGSLRFTPAAKIIPDTEEEVCEVVRRCRGDGGNLRVAGAGHSSSPLAETEQTLVSLERFKGIVRYDKKEGTATLRTGLTVHEANQELQRVGLALFNTGDVDVQMLTGAISTGTHGTGKRLQNLSSMLQGVRMVTADGDVKAYTERERPELMKALRVSLGSLGIFTEITVKVLPLFRLKRRELCISVDDCLAHFDQLADENRNADFYWYPRSDEVKVRLLNEPGEGTVSFPFVFKCHKEEEGWIGEVLPKRRELRFDEMEYSFPAEAAMSCFREVRKRIREKHRKEVAWRVLYRTIAADENYLSPQFKRDSVTISIHHNAGLPFTAYFSDIEPVFKDHGGRPHWGKKHTLKAAQLEKLYPLWNNFHKIRASLDPRGVFMNGYLKEIFGTA